MPPLAPFLHSPAFGMLRGRRVAIHGERSGGLHEVRKSAFCVGVVILVLVGVFVVSFVVVFVFVYLRATKALSEPYPLRPYRANSRTVSEMG